MSDLERKAEEISISAMEILTPAFHIFKKQKEDSGRPDPSLDQALAVCSNAMSDAAALLYIATSGKSFEDKFILEMIENLKQKMVLLGFRIGE